MRKTAVLISVLVFMSCGKSAVKKPANLIPENQMVEILFDVILINSAKGVNKQLLQNKIENPLNYIYRTHGIDSLQFTESNTYYTYHTDQYNTIYEKVESKLDIEKAAYEAIIDAQKRIKDSIKKSRKNKIDTTKIAREKIKSIKKSLLPSSKFDSLRK
jgi:hypothetical protein|tara:strand:+ start:43 stop:519 length:477 start_codon:yes stop_codon:yes gene_type:complete